MIHIPILLLLTLLLQGCIRPLPGTPNPSEVKPFSVTATAAPPSLEAGVEGLVYFTSQARYNLGTPPFEVAVIRIFPHAGYTPEAVLDEFFKGPTQKEQELGLVKINSGFSGFNRLEAKNGGAHLYLEGQCSSMGATYTIAQPILANLLQFSEIEYVKIYDNFGSTGEPGGKSNSIPGCLEP
jgi:hypothetical protein